MRVRSSATVALVFLGIVFGWTSAAAGQYGGIQRTLFRGAEFAGNNRFWSNPQTGPLFDFNIFEQRVEYNRAGGGYTYEFMRFFGPDSFNNQTTLDLGPLKVEMSLDPTLVASGQPAGIHGRMGYTTRFIPEVFFEGQTGQRAFNNFSGIGSFVPVPLRYTVSFNAGVQDFEWSGNALLDMNGRINALGFYDFEMRFTNVGSFEAGGLVLQDEQVTDFDIGPINVSGNIGFDFLAGLLQADGATTDALPPRIYSGAAQKDKTIDELIARLNAGEGLSDSEMKFLAERMFAAAFTADPIGVMTNGMPSEVPGFEGLAFAMSASLDDGSDGGPQNRLAPPVPEPGTLGLLLIVAIGHAAVRSHLRRRH